ncbi:MAG: thiol reductase thioredoxin [Burkholderiales bacterium PBB4]|nr:MAG: thiol reductase thioredoxin [Burkholderiales bacterium PBB4]
MPSEIAALPHPLLIACLCAQWCGTCRDYRALFEGLRADFPDAHFVWVDVEDQADLVDPVEVENFPTLLMAQGPQPLFFGTVTPHLETLRRLIHKHLHEQASSALTDQDVLELVQRLQSKL